MIFHQYSKLLIGNHGKLFFMQLLFLIELSLVILNIKLQKLKLLIYKEILIVI